MLCLDGMTPNADHTVALGKLFASCFLIRGAQLAVVRRLDAAYVVSVHVNAISFICKKLAGYEAAKNKKGRDKCLMFFKALSMMLASVDSRDSLKMCVHLLCLTLKSTCADFCDGCRKAHLDQVMAQSKLTPVTSNNWDPYHAYVRRLTTAKDKGKPSSSFYPFECHVHHHSH